MGGRGSYLEEERSIGGGNRQCEALKSAWWRGSCTEMVFSLIHLCLTWTPRAQLEGKQSPRGRSKNKWPRLCSSGSPGSAE